MPETRAPTRARRCARSSRAICTRTPTGPTAATRSRRWPSKARDLGHEYLALTDHSPRLKIANGLSADRLREQLDVVAALNDELAPFRILTGVEVDILDDGALDQHEELLARVDVVVASVHSKLRMEADAMTRRMVAAVASPHVDVLGHCTGRLLVGRGRPESTFDDDVVIEACRQFDTALEVNCRPERLDPPKRILTKAVEAGLQDRDQHRRARDRAARVAAVRHRPRRRVRRDAPIGS